MRPLRYRKKPVVIDAMQFTGVNVVDVCQFIMEGGGGFEPGIGNLGIVTLEGVMEAHPGDWIIKGIKGEFYPCKPDIFDATYELANKHDVDV